MSPQEKLTAVFEKKTEAERKMQPFLVAEAIRDQPVETLAQWIDAVPEAAIYNYILNSPATPNPYLTSMFRTQFLEHYSDLFKPNLKTMYDGDYSRYARLFEGKKGIFNYFKENVLDVVDYENPTRRAPVGMLGENGTLCAKPLPDDIFSHHSIVTDISIVGKDTAEREDRAAHFIEAFQYLLKPCWNCMFKIVNEGDKTYVRTDINATTFSALGSIVINAAYLELTTEEMAERVREGQKRLWQNEKAREVGRLAVPGAFEMASMGLPGISFRSDMVFDHNHHVQPSPEDKAYVQAHTPYRESPLPTPDLFLQHNREKVMELIPQQLDDGRFVHTVSPSGKAAKEVYKQFREALSVKTVAESIHLTGIIMNTASAATAVVRAMLGPVQQSYASDHAWRNRLAKMDQEFEAQMKAQAQAAAERQRDAAATQHHADYVAQQFDSHRAATDARRQLKHRR